MNALRIFAHVPRLRSLVRPGRPLPLVVNDETTTAIIAPAITSPIEENETKEVLEHIDRDVTSVIETMTCEQTIIDILVTPPHYGETIEAAYRRKERELTELFATLARGEAAALLKRLSDPRTEDALATRFARLVIDRRTRLLTLLADAPRREARRR
jgi:hypothetical protein